MGKWLLFLLAIALFACDFLSKRYTHDHIALLSYSTPVYPYGGIGVFYDWLGIHFSLNYATNQGAAWGMLASFPQLLLYFRIAVIAGILIYLFFINRVVARALPLTLIVVGAIGNVLDYFLYGHVVDLFHFVFWGYSFPIFNVADSTIFCGISVLLIQSFLAKRNAQRAADGI